MKTILLRILEKILILKHSTQFFILYSTTLNAFVEIQKIRGSFYICIHLTQCLIERKVQTLTKVARENRLGNSRVYGRALVREETFTSR